MYRKEITNLHDSYRQFINTNSIENKDELVDIIKTFEIDLNGKIKTLKPKLEQKLEIYQSSVKGFQDVKLNDLFEIKNNYFEKLKLSIESTPINNANYNKKDIMINYDNLRKLLVSSLLIESDNALGIYNFMDFLKNQYNDEK